MNLYINAKSRTYSGGWKSYTKSTIMNFGIPLLSQIDKEYIKEETDKDKIDDYLFKLYDI